MSFKEEEELRLYLEVHGRYHDCLEAKCKLNPNNKEIASGGKPAKKPKHTKKMKALFKKYRKKDLK